MARRGRSQASKNKSILDDFDNETYNRLSTEARHLAEKHQIPRLKNIFNEACEKWALTYNEVEKHREIIETLKEENAGADTDNKALINKNKELQKRIDDLLDEYDEQTKKSDKQIEDNNIKIKCMEKRLREMKSREIEDYKYIEQLEHERNGMKMTINGLEKAIDNLKTDYRSLTYLNESVLELENTISNNSVLQLSKSFSLLNSEKTFQQELIELKDSQVQNLEKNFSNTNDPTTTQESHTMAPKNLKIIRSTKDHHNKVDKVKNQNSTSQNSKNQPTVHKPMTMNEKAITETNEINKNNLNKTSKNITAVGNEKQKNDETNTSSDDKLKQLEETMTTMNQDIQGMKKKIEQLVLPIEKERNSTSLKNNGQTNEQKIHLIGDSHIRYLKKEMENKLGNSNCIEIRENFRSGYNFAGIVKELIPKNINNNDTLVISAGTNDLYKTEWNDVKKHIDTITQNKNKIIFILIPPQQNNSNNKNIIKLNTLIKHHCEQLKHVDIIDPHKFIKIWHLSYDGLHLGRKGKLWLSMKIIEAIEYSMKGDDLNKESNEQHSIQAKKPFTHTGNEYNNVRNKQERRPRRTKEWHQNESYAQRYNNNNHTYQNQWQTQWKNTYNNTQQQNQWQNQRNYNQNQMQKLPYQNTTSWNHKERNIYKLRDTLDQTEKRHTQYNNLTVNRNPPTHNEENQNNSRCPTCQHAPEIRPTYNQSSRGIFF